MLCCGKLGDHFAWPGVKLKKFWRRAGVVEELLMRLLRQGGPSSLKLSAHLDNFRPRRPSSLEFARLSLNHGANVAQGSAQPMRPLFCISAPTDGPQTSREAVDASASTGRSLVNIAGSKPPDLRQGTRLECQGFHVKREFEDGSCRAPKDPPAIIAEAGPG